MFRQSNVSTAGIHGEGREEGKKEGGGGYSQISIFTIALFEKGGIPLAILEAKGEKKERKGGGGGKQPKSLENAYYTISPIEEKEDRGKGLFSLSLSITVNGRERRGGGGGKAWPKIANGMHL